MSHVEIILNIILKYHWIVPISRYVDIRQYTHVRITTLIRSIVLAKVQRGLF